jgi:polysaccharide deacetylase family protein (PEP-CTERM system associated)
VRMATNAFREQGGGAPAAGSVPSHRPTASRAAQAPAGALTVDVEDYFQVEAFKGVIDRNRWESMPVRVEENTQRLLDLFAEAGVSGTFFVLGWVAERFPGLARRIAEAGHEVASHGYAHQLAHLQTPDVFRDDVRRARKLLEDASGQPVRGYRAPTFSLRKENWWAYDVLAEEGYDYSSSLYPVSHDLYGMPDAPTVPFRPTASRLVEIPLSTTRLFRRNIPCSGGGYFRLMPYAWSRWCINRVSGESGSAYVFYCHPWEFDLGQPRIKAGFKSSFRHYTNIGRMHGRVSRMLKEFNWDRMDRVFSHELDKSARA